MQKFYVTGPSGIPLYGQPCEGYTMQQAINRLNREVAEMKRLGFAETTDRDFSIVDTKNFNTYL